MCNQIYKGKTNLRKCTFWKQSALWFSAPAVSSSSVGLPADLGAFSSSPQTPGSHTPALSLPRFSLRSFQTRAQPDLLPRGLYFPPHSHLPHHFGSSQITKRLRWSEILGSILQVKRTNKPVKLETRVMTSSCPGDSRALNIHLGVISPRGEQVTVPQAGYRPPKICPHPHPLDLRLCYLTW